jgi:hypothetical protein
MLQLCPKVWGSWGFLRGISGFPDKLRVCLLVQPGEACRGNSVVEPPHMRDQERKLTSSKLNPYELYDAIWEAACAVGRRDNSLCQPNAGFAGQNWRVERLDASSFRSKQSQSVGLALDLARED